MKRQGSLGSREILQRRQGMEDETRADTWAHHELPLML